MSGWTPGPWKRSIVESDAVTTSNGEYYIASLSGHIPGTKDAIEGNGNLIAAAPDMAEALMPFVEIGLSQAVDGPDWNDDDKVDFRVSCREMRAAIRALAKANGES